MPSPQLRVLAFIGLTIALCLAAAPAEEVLVTLNSGEVLRGEITSDKDGVVVMRHPLLGELKIQRSAITKISPAPALPAPPQKQSEAAPPAAPATQAAATAPPAAPATAATPPAPAAPAPQVAEKPADKPADAVAIKAAPPAPDYTVAKTAAEVTKETEEAAKDPHAPVWKAHFELAGTFTDATNTQFDIRAAAQATRETIDDKLKMYAEYYFKTLNPNPGSNSNVTDNNLLTNITYDAFINPTKWLWFGKGQYQYDMNQSWENRISAWGGVGYRFFDDPKALTLTGKVGVGATHEFGSSDTTQPNGYGEIALGWQISERQKFNFSTYISPDLSNFSNYFVQTRLEWSMKLDMYSGLGLVAGLRDDYQSQPSNGATGNDFRMYFGLKLDL
jgi:hypothetical protein